MRRAVVGVGITFFLALSTAGSAGSQPRAALPPAVIGVTDDVFKYADDPGAYLDQAKALGLSEVRVTVLWDLTSPDGYFGEDRAFLARSLPQAAERNMQVVFAVYPTKARALTDDPANVDRFVDFLTSLARTWTSVRQFVVLNEPNQPRFLQPQFVDGKPFACGFAEGVLARAYDALKTVDASISVIGFGMSPRGNDDPSAPNNVSRSPVRCMKDVGDAYRASGRQQPIMDLLGQHLYPNDPAKDDGTKQVQWPNVSYTTLDRMAQAFWDAFHGTAQPTMVEGSGGARSTAALGVPPSVRFKIDEIGWQVKILDSLRTKYSGQENVDATTEDAQADTYAYFARNALCNSLVAELLYYHLIDESDLDRFQSGLFRVDGSPRPSADAVRQAIEQGLANCTGTNAHSFRHGGAVQGTSIRFTQAGGGSVISYLDFDVVAEEDALYQAILIRADGRTFDPAKPEDRAKIVAAFTPGRSLASAGALRVVARRSGGYKAYHDGLVSLRAAKLPPGRYVSAIRLTAWATPDRTSLKVSPVFTVGPKKSN